tara:strand:+ start:395 stop:913 length:519 start_codon:yes stop_codon:yes gene_type:complete
MERSDCLYDINLTYNKDKLISEMKSVNFHPFNDLGPEQQGVSKIPEGHWFHNPPTWLLGHVVEEGSEVDKVKDQLRELFGSQDIRPRYYKQEANTSVPMHADTGTLSAVNIVLSDEYGPIEFDGLGLINYNCALIDTQKRHGVPSHSKERVLLKFSMFDITFNECKEKIINK